MLLLEKIYKSFFLLVVFIVGGIYFLIQLAIMLWSNQIKAQELILYTGWVLLSIVYLIDRFKYELFKKHRGIYVLAIYFALILMAIYNQYL
jgi:hypothetical protein